MRARERHDTAEARRIQPPSPQLDARADYADAFEIPIGEDDSRTAEQAFRDGLRAEPGVPGHLVLWIHRHVLRFRLGPFTSADHVIGWKIVHSDPDRFVLTTDGSLMRGQLALRRQADRHAVITTQLFFRHRVTARMVWAVIGPVHRAIAPRLIEHSSRRAAARTARR
jgi:Protein of unknown function (DUF2867)